MWQAASGELEALCPLPPNSRSFPPVVGPGPSAHPQQRIPPRCSPAAPDRRAAGAIYRVRFRRPTPLTGKERTKSPDDPPAPPYLELRYLLKCDDVTSRHVLVR